METKQKAAKPAPTKKQPEQDPSTAPQVPADQVKPDPPAPDEANKARYLIAGRYCLPPFGGIPMPPNVHFPAFVEATLTEAQEGKGISEKQALAALRNKLKQEVQDLTVVSVSLLPQNW